MSVGVLCFEMARMSNGEQERDEQLARPLAGGAQRPRSRGRRGRCPAGSVLTRGTWFGRDWMVERLSGGLLRAHGLDGLLSSLLGCCSMRDARMFGGLDEWNAGMRCFAGPYRLWSGFRQAMDETDVGRCRQRRQGSCAAALERWRRQAGTMSHFGVALIRRDCDNLHRTTHSALDCPATPTTPR